MHGGDDRQRGASITTTCPGCSAPELERKPDRLRRELRIGAALLVTALFTLAFLQRLLQLLIPMFFENVVFRIPSSYTLAQKLNPWIYILIYLFLLQFAYRITITLMARYRPQRLICKQCGSSHYRTPGLTWRSFLRLLFTPYLAEEVESE